MFERECGRDFKKCRVRIPIPHEITNYHQAIRDCVDELSERCRALIDMLYFDARSPSYQEISQMMGMPVASIGPNRARCLEKLKKILQRRGVT